MCDIPPDSYLAESARLEVVTDFLAHEVSKLDSPIYTTSLVEVSGRTSQSHSELLAALRSAYTPPIQGEQLRAFLGNLSLSERWKLFHAVSCGGLVKDLFNSVGHPAFEWTRESVLLHRTRFETKVGALHGFEEEHPTFAQAVDFLKTSNAEDQNPHALQDPLVGRAEGDFVLIHDGNGRLLSYAFACIREDIPEDHHVEIWVGRDREPAAAECAAYQQATVVIFRKAE
jgi:hypothetical protein